MTTILVIDDEPEIRKFLKTALTSHGHEMIEAANGKDGLKALTTHKPDLVILDLGLPDRDGLDILREVRGWSQIPILVLSARGQEQDKVTALEEGADDYLTKPFGVAELLARIKVALRHATSSSQPEAQVFEQNGLRLDHAARRVFVDGVEVHLTPLEYKLLTQLTRHAGKVVTHNQLLKEIWGKYAAETNQYLRIHMQHLRQKLGDNPLNPRFFITEPGIGYRFKSEP